MPSSRIVLRLLVVAVFVFSLESSYKLSEARRELREIKEHVADWKTRRVWEGAYRAHYNWVYHILTAHPDLARDWGAIEDEYMSYRGREHEMTDAVADQLFARVAAIEKREPPINVGKAHQAQDKTNRDFYGTDDRDQVYAMGLQKTVYPPPHVGIGQ